MAHLFNHAGKPWLSQYWTRKVSQIAFGGTTPHDGYCGEEDQGQMGALSALMKIGLFSERGACAADPIYELTAPEFDEITIQLDPKYYSGKTFKIKAYNNSPENCYIQKVKLNGKRLDNCWIYQRELAAGGLLELWLGSEPNKNWGKGLPPVKPGGATKDALWRQYKVMETAAHATVKEASRMFRAMDGNGDEQVTRAEFVGFWVKAFRNQDEDGDGMLNVTELGSAAGFKSMDANQDGKASLSEFKTMYGKQFDGRDKNRNGSLDTDEL